MNEPERIVCNVEMLKSLSNGESKCYICSISVKTKANLKAHMIKTHKVIENEFDEAFYRKKKSEKRRIFHCPIDECKYNIITGNGVKKYSILKQHYMWVHTPRSHICLKCEKSFGTAPALKYHQKTCGIRFICDICGVNFVQKKFHDIHKLRNHNKPSTLPGNPVQIQPSKDGNQIIQPIYLPIVVPVNVNDSNNLLNKVSNGTFANELLQTLNNKPAKRDAEVQVTPPTENFFQNYPTTPQFIEGYTEVITYDWANNPLVSSVPNCNVSMQTVEPSFFYQQQQTQQPQHQNDLYNVQTQTLCTPTHDMFDPPSLLMDAECMTTGNEWLQLSDNHTQTNTSGLSLDNFVDLTDIQTQTCLNDIDNLFK